MAVSTIYAPVRQAGNGATVAFSASFKILADSDVVAYKGSAATPTVWTKGVLNVDYAVTKDAIAETVTVTWVVAPVQGGYSLIGRASAETQGTVYPRDSALPAKATEACVDKLTLLVQELFQLFLTVPAFPLTYYQPPALKIQTPATRRAMIYVDNGDGTFNIIPSTYDPDTQVAAAAASAAAAAASADQLTAELSGLYSAKPAAPATAVYYYSTDRDSYEKWVPAAARWFLQG